MKNIILLSFFVIFSQLLTFSQWQPTPKNPFKYYKVVKDTNWNGFEVNHFYVRIDKFEAAYKEFKVDSLGHMVSYPFCTKVFFRELPSEEAGSYDNSGIWDRFNNWWVYFEGLTFECESDQNYPIGITGQINIYLAIKYNVTLSKIIE